MINPRAADDTRHLRGGKDGAFYDEDGNLMATVEKYSSNVTFNNSKNTVLGDAQEHETTSSFAVSLTMSQVVIESDKFIQMLVNALETQDFPELNFSGVIQGRNGSEERVIYRNCVLSGQIDLQNVSVGETVKRNWNFFVNKAPKLQSLLSIN